MQFEYSRMVAGGLDLRVGRIEGTDTGAAPLLMLNGIGFNAELMEPLARALAESAPGRAVVIPDMPGCGGSGDLAIPYTMMRMAAAMAEMMDALFPGVPFDCLGFSWGGALAQQIAVQSSAQVARLALVSTTCGLPVAPANPDVLKRLFDPKEYIDPRRLNENLRALLVEGGASAGLLRRFQTPTPSGIGSQILSLAAWSAAPLLPFVRMPVALVAAADDAIVPIAHHRLLACLLPQARSIELPNGGHLVSLASPERIAAELSAFFGQRLAAAAA